MAQIDGWLATFGTLDEVRRIKDMCTLGDMQNRHLAEQPFPIHEARRFSPSLAVALEVLIKPFRGNQRDMITGYNKVFFEAIRIPTFDAVFLNALTFARKDGLKALDAIHVAFAVNHECELFVTTVRIFVPYKVSPSIGLT